MMCLRLRLFFGTPGLAALPGGRVVAPLATHTFGNLPGQ
jgi:hypothetical protein